MREIPSAPKPAVMCPPFWTTQTFGNASASRKTRLDKPPYRSNPELVRAPPRGRPEGPGEWTAGRYLRASAAILRSLRPLLEMSGRNGMSTATDTTTQIPWWKEPTKDQWIAWWAAWLGWTLDAFDFTVFLLIMVPISQEFGVPMTEVAFVLTITLWLRLVGAVGSGWLADRVGRKIPLMISILWYSVANFIAGFSPTFLFLAIFRALLGIGMGAEWAAGAALSMETWPARSRGFMGGVLQGSWGLGFLLSSAAYGLLYTSVGLVGLLWMGILPAFAVLFVRRYVKEPEVWIENRKRQRLEGREVHVPLFAIFKPGVLGNTLTACWWMASGFITYYSINALFATHLQKDLGLSPALVATPIALGNVVVFVASGSWGWVADRIGRPSAVIIPAPLAISAAT